MTAGRNSVTTTKQWCTPPHIVASVHAVMGGIDLDPCSNEHSTVGATVNYLLPETDGLIEHWDFGRIYVNPPYGSDMSRGTRISHWFERIAFAAQSGSEVIVLAPVATNTGHWKKHVFPVARAVCFLYQPRLRFFIDGREDAKGAPMSCAVIYYGSSVARFAQEFRQHGAVVPLGDVSLPLSR